jgi:hypothetical protein
LTVNFHEKAEFVCEVADPEATGKWMLNGKPISEKVCNKII